MLWDDGLGIQLVLDHGRKYMFKKPTSRTRKRLLTVRETATYIGRTETAVRELAWQGKLPYIRSDRRVMFDIRDLERWIDENRVLEGAHV